MPNIIHIETSTSVCSAALSSDGVVQCHFENFEGPSHASLLGVYVKQIMDFSRDKGVKVDAVAVSSGPGSYTGLRIGVSEGKFLSSQFLRSNFWLVRPCLETILRKMCYIVL